MTYTLNFLDQVALINPFPVKEIYLQVWDPGLSNIECTKLAKYICLTECVHIEKVQTLLPESLLLIEREFKKMILNNETPSLKELRFYACNLADDHLKALLFVLPFLSTLVFSYSKDISLDGWKVLASVFASEHCLIKRFDIRDCKLNDEVINILTPCLANVEALDLNENENISFSGWENISAAFLSTSYKLRKLCIRSCRINDDIVEVLLPVFENLTELDISFNKEITSLGWGKIADLLERKDANGSSLQHLNIKGCSRHEYDVLVKNSNVSRRLQSGSFIIDAVDGKIPYSPNERRRKVRSTCDMPDSSIINADSEAFKNEIHFVDKFDFSHNKNISLATWRCIVDGIKKKSTSIEEICLHECDLTDEHLAVLAPIIVNSRKVKLSRNHLISPAGWKALGMAHEVASFGSFTESINLISCKLTDQCIDCFKSMIPSLHYLKLAGNTMVTPVGWSVISDVVLKSGCLNLQFLNLRDCNLTDESIEVLQPIIHQLVSLKLGGNVEITTVGWKCIKEVSNKSPFRLRELNIIRCLVTDEDIIVLMPLIVLLFKLDVRFNKCITTIGWNFVAIRIMNHPQINLKILDARSCCISNVDLKSLEEVIGLVLV